jgi:hypothetical protein
MKNSKEPKWEIGQTIYAGNQAYELGKKYQPDIEGRLKPGQLDELSQYVEELQRKRTGQSENLTKQKSKTQDQNSTQDTLHQDVMDTRDMVKSATDDAGILKAFGVGEKVQKSVTSVTAAGNTLLEGYNQHKEWANSEAGIVEEDMADIQTGVDALSTADTVQEQSKFVRKASTMDKNALQRSVEDLVTKISAIGVKVFRKKDPNVVPLFEGLIPS